MQKISLLLAIPIVLATSLVFGSLSFNIYGQESQTITPAGNQTTTQTTTPPTTTTQTTTPQAAPATTDNATTPQAAPATTPQAAPATTDNATTPQTTSPQNNQTSSQSSGGDLKLENILQWSNGAVIANNEGNATGVSENLLKLQEYLVSSSGDKVISLPANQRGSG
jgi:hypothetical protein